MRPSITSRTRARRSPARVSSHVQVGPWRLEMCIGEGRWTRVYRACPQDKCEHTDYALKMLKPEYRRDQTAVHLLQREAVIGRDLVHPHLISILAAKTDCPPYYLVTPYLEGATLRQAIHYSERLAVPYALWLGRQIAEALLALHRHGWMHTDIKPDNILVAANGHLTVSDLGLARAMDRASSHEVLAGTPAYLPPEAFCANVELTAASDVYSLGVTLYESLTGRLPFPQRNPVDSTAALLTQAPPDPRHIVPQMPRRVARLLRHLLAKDPIRRPSVSDLIDWLVDLEIDTFDERPTE